MNNIHCSKKRKTVISTFILVLFLITFITFAEQTETMDKNIPANKEENQKKTDDSKSQAGNNEKLSSEGLKDIKKTETNKEPQKEKVSKEKIDLENLPPVKLTKAAIKERIEIIERTTELPEDSKKRIIAFYNEAISSLERRQTALQKSAEFEEMIKLDNTSESTQDDTLLFVRPMAIEQKAKSMALSEIEGKIADLQAQLAVQQTNLEITQKLQDEIIHRPTKMRNDISSYEKELATLQSQLDNPESTDLPPRVIRARRTSIMAKSEALKAELKAAENKAELSKYKITEVNDKLAKLSRKVSSLKKLIKTWGDIKESRQTDIGYTELRQNSYTLQQLDNKTYSNIDIAFLKELSKKNIALAKEIVSIGQKENEADKALEILTTRKERMENDFKLTSRRIAMMGLNKKSGDLLQAKRAILLTSRADPSIARKRNELILAANLANDDVIQEAQNYLPFKDEIYNKLDNLDSKKIPTQVNNQLTTTAFVLLESYRRLLEESGKIYAKYIKTLNEQQLMQKKIDQTSKEFRDYINQRLLWTSSSNVYNINSFTGTVKTIEWLFNTPNWKTFIQDIKASFYQKPSVWVLLIIGLLIAVLLQFILPAKIEKINKHYSRPYKDSAGRTIAVVSLVIIQAISIPIIFYLTGTHIFYMRSSHIFTRAISAGIIDVSSSALIICLIAFVGSKNGIGIKNFKWSKEVCSFVRKFLITFFVVIIPFSFFIVTIQNGPQNLNFRSTLGRTLAIIVYIIIIIFVISVIKKIKKISEKTRFLAWFNRNKNWLAGLTISALIILIILTITGYYFTAYEFTENLIYSIVLIIIFMLIKEVLSRIIYISQIKVAVNQALEKKKLEEEKRKQEEVSPETTADILDIDIVDNVIEKGELNEQTFQLMNFILFIAFIIGIVLIWSNVFPSIQFLNNIVIWSSNVITKEGGTVVQPISLLNLVQSIFILICTIVLVRNLAAIVELLFFRGKKAHPGTRHAFILISKYLFSAIGFFMALKFVGIGWAQFQYIAAAMTLGLSFGLQDIFANFVSGIIILIERPIRLGDSVTVGGNSGVVTKIRIRSTTITDWNRHELIVPNKAFLAEKITNWSLSDQIMRVVIDIGIGYSSDAKKAEKILLEIAKDNPKVLEAPAPSVVFVGFGADSLDFKLRVFVNLENQTSAQHQIRHEINERFAKAGIEIPFAQRDVHISPNEGPLKIEFVNKEKK